MIEYLTYSIFVNQKMHLIYDLTYSISHDGVLKAKIEHSTYSIFANPSQLIYDLTYSISRGTAPKLKIEHLTYSIFTMEIPFLFFSHIKYIAQTTTKQIKTKHEDGNYQSWSQCQCIKSTQCISIIFIEHIS